MAQVSALSGSGCSVDHIVASFRMESGALASITMGDSGVSNLLGKFSLEITAKNGAASVYSRFEKAEMNLGNTRYHCEGSENKAAIEQMRVFTQLVRGKQVFGLATIEDGFWADWMLDQAIHSAKTGNEMKFVKEPLQ